MPARPGPTGGRRYRCGVHGARSLAFGDDRLRVAPWRGDPQVAYLVARTGRPSAASVARCLEELADGGFRAALTAALPPGDHRPYVANGFVVRERLHLLVRPVEPLLEPEQVPGVGLRRARRRDRGPVLAVDDAAFPSFWHLDAAGLDDAIGATPSARFRVVHRASRPDDVVGYAVTGRAGSRGYLQRLAVHPEAQRTGAATALVADALRWLRRWGGREVLVNTQEGNDAAMALYERLGFRRHAEGLAVLERPIGGATS
jgi:ribosomal protein S18 acetylase RimI-like enzyme